MRARRFMTPCKNAKDENDEATLDVSLNSVGRESFGCISPISKSITPQSRPKSLPSSRKKEDSASSLFRSTPDRSSIGRWKSFETSNDNAVNCSHSSKRKSFHITDDPSSESNDTVNFSYDDEMQLSYGSQQHPQTPTMNKSKRRCSSVNRKNLSRSFNQIEEQQHSGLSLDRTDSGFNDMNDYNSAQMKLEPNFPFHDLTNIKCNNFADKNADISMVSIN